MAKPHGWAFRWRGVVGILVLLPLVLVVVFGRGRIHPDSAEALALQGAGWALLLSGVYLRVVSCLFVGGRKGKSLVTEGPYAMCRNPLYLGSLLIALSFSLFMYSATLLAGILVVSTFYLSLVIRAEERQLEAAFPAEWKAYASRVPRILPRLRRPARSGTREIEFRTLRKESLRAIGALLFPLAARGLELLRQHPGWPVWWSLP